jgi:hypothetical protein
MHDTADRFKAAEFELRLALASSDWRMLASVCATVRRVFKNVDGLGYGYVVLDGNNRGSAFSERNASWSVVSCVMKRNSGGNLLVEISLSANALSTSHIA